MFKNTIFYSLMMVAFILFGCDTQRKVTRIDPDKQTDLSGRWNDTDSRLVAGEMVTDVLGRPWRLRFEDKYGRKPVIIVGLVKNKTDEHIDPETFIKNLEREFINTGLVRVVQGGEFREQIREERADQQKYSSLETQAKWGKELGADYILTGVMMSNTDSYKSEKTVAYQINLELTDLESNEKVWIGEKKIKKYIEN